MKKFTVALLIATLGCGSLFAGGNYEEDRVFDRSFKVGFDATYILFGAYLLHGEFKVSDNMSLTGRGGYIDNRITINKGVNAAIPATFGKAELGARWYLKPTRMDGFFLESRIGLDFGKTYSGAEATIPEFGDATVGPWIFNLGHSVEVGYSWVTDIGFFVDAVVGFSGGVFWGGPNSPVVEWDPATNLNVGWAF